MEEKQLEPSRQTKFLSFSVEGGFITKLAREKCYYDGNFYGAIELLMSCMETDQLEEREIRHMAIDILNGEAELKGTYPGDDYGFRYLEKKNEAYDLGKFIEKVKEYKKRLEELEQKYCFVVERLSEYEKRELNEEYDVDYGENLFEKDERDEMLESFLKRQRNASDDDYGWLEPSGKYHPVEWGLHQDWARDYLESTLSKDDYLDSIKCATLPGDVLVRKGWILLHNPAQGIALITRSEDCRITKAQKDFLYGYYVDRDCSNKANEVMNM